MADAQSRRDISDGTWELLRPHLKGRKGTWGIGRAGTAPDAATPAATGNS
jgi:hypothetical protein